MTDLEQVMVNALTVIPFTPPMPSSPLDHGRFPSGRGELGTEANAYVKIGRYASTFPLSTLLFRTFKNCT